MSSSQKRLPAGMRACTGRMSWSGCCCTAMLRWTTNQTVSSLRLAWGVSRGLNPNPQTLSSMRQACQCPPSASSVHSDSSLVIIRCLKGAAAAWQPAEQCIHAHYSRNQLQRWVCSCKVNMPLGLTCLWVFRGALPAMRQHVANAMAIACVASMLWHSCYPIHATAPMLRHPCYGTHANPLMLPYPYYGTYAMATAYVAGSGARQAAA